MGFMADRLFGDPARWHPVAGFGTTAARLEKLVYRDQRPAGIGYTTTLVAGASILGAVLERRSFKVAATAVGTWVVLGGRSLEREALEVGRFLSVGDLPSARTQVGRLVGRRTAEMSEIQVARAAVESMAENTSDAVVAPLFWGAVLGTPGLLGYRAINTLDAMVGHHNPRYENFGWAAAKLDDVANYLPARLAAALTVIAAPAGRRQHTAVIRRRDGHRHPSPNGGQVEAAFAGALDVRLGGVNDYGDHIEERPTLGDGRQVSGPDIQRAASLARRVDRLAAGVAVGVALLVGLLKRAVVQRISEGKQ